MVDGSKLRYVTQDVALYLFESGAGCHGSGFDRIPICSSQSIIVMENKSCYTCIKPSTSNSPNDQLNLTNRQLGLLGLKRKFQQVEVKPAKEAPNTKANASPADKLIPIHQPSTGSGHTPHLNREKSITSGGNKMRSFSTPSKPPVSSSVYLVPSQSPVCLLPLHCNEPTPNEPKRTKVVVW